MPPTLSEKTSPSTIRQSVFFYFESSVTARHLTQADSDMITNIECVFKRHFKLNSMLNEAKTSGGLHHTKHCAHPMSYYQFAKCQKRINVLTPMQNVVMYCSG